MTFALEMDKAAVIATTMETVVLLIFAKTDIVKSVNLFLKFATITVNIYLSFLSKSVRCLHY